MKKIFVLIIVFFLFIYNVSAIELDIVAEHVVLYNVNEDRIIYEKNSKEETSIASLTKLMTVLVALEEVKDLDTNIELKEEVFKGLIEANASVVGFKVGEIVTIRDLLYGAMLPSGADATNALTIYISGSEKEFVKLMNVKAKEIGMYDTIFQNASGLDLEGQTSTVLDVLTLLKYALKNELFKEIFTTNEYTTTNDLILKSTIMKYTERYGIELDYVYGAKTGYTGNAGLCLASIASYNDTDYILITTRSMYNGKTYPYHMSDANTIYNYFFTNYDYQTTINKGDLLLTIPVKDGLVDVINYYAPNNISLYLPKEYDKTLLIYKFNGLGELTSNNKSGDYLGDYDIFYDGEHINSIKLFINEDMAFSLSSYLTNDITKSLRDSITDYLHYIVFGIGVLMFLISIILRKKVKEVTNL